MVYERILSNIFNAKLVFKLFQYSPIKCGGTRTNIYVLKIIWFDQIEAFLEDEIVSDQDDHAAKLTK